MNSMEIRLSFVIIDLKSKIIQERKKGMEILEYDSAA